MKKLNQAMAYFEDAIKESDEIIAECSEALQKELIEQKEHFIVALQAMKKQIPQKVVRIADPIRTPPYTPYKCPNGCGLVKTRIWDEYCFQCGQKLDWESGGKSNGK